MTAGSDAPDGPAGAEPVPEGDELDQQRPVAPEPQRRRASHDPEAPEADTLDQGAETAPGERAVVERGRQEASEADVWEQSLEVPLDEDDDRR